MAVSDTHDDGFYHSQLKEVYQRSHLKLMHSFFIFFILSSEISYITTLVTFFTGKNLWNGEKKDGSLQGVKVSQKENKWPCMISVLVLKCCDCIISMLACGHSSNQ